MTYRTKLTLLLTATALATNAGAMALTYAQSRSIVYAEIQSKVRSIAATAAALLDGAVHDRIRTRDDEQGEAYRQLENQLRRVRDANRRDDVYVKFVYTLRAAGEGQVEFGVDPEESEDDKSHVGDAYDATQGRAIHVDRLEADDSFTTDQWGSWLGANAPLRDASGSAVAALGVDVAADAVGVELRSVLYAGLVALAAALVLAGAIALWLSRRVSGPLYELRRVVTAIGGGDLDARVVIHSRDEFGQVGDAVNQMAAGLRERAALKSAFARYVSQHVMESILDNGEAPVVAGTRKKVTVLFSDIRGFTTLARAMRPEEVVSLLNEYFERMIDVVFRHHGMLDKLLGDGLMAVFGAPLDDAEQEAHAVRAALAMQDELVVLCDKWEAEGRPRIRVGIGIHTGDAIVGNVGSSQRMEYTAIGDTVNVASRLESATKDLGVDILVSEETHEALGQGFPARRMPPVNVKGIAEPLVTWAVEIGPGAPPGASSDEDGPPVVVG